jgi:cyclopropane-fatty-acyl-phospholipid synthase
MVFQIQLARKLDTVPRTRAYMANEEARLRQVELAKAAHPIAAE